MSGRGRGDDSVMQALTPPLPHAFTATVTPTGYTFTVGAEQTLLQAAELASGGAVDFQIDSSCRNGTCRTCICQLVEGKVAYRIEWPGLSQDEKLAGYILPCVAYPKSDVVLLLPI